MANRFSNQIPMEYRLMDGEAPTIIVDGIEDLAAINQESLDKTVSLTAKIHQTLAYGLDYKGTLPAGYTDLEGTVQEYISLIGNINSRSVNFSSDFESSLIRLSGEIRPLITQVDYLFKSGYHRPSHFAEGQTVNVLKSWGSFNSLFADPVTRLSTLLSGGSKPKVSLKTVSTMEELIRVLHDNAITNFTSLIHSLAYEERFRDKLPLTNLDSQRGLNTFLIGTDLDNRASQILPALEAVREYFTESNSVSRFDNFIDFYSLLTQQSMSSFLIMDRDVFGDKVNGSLHVFNDPKKSKCQIKLHCGNKGYFSEFKLKQLEEAFKSRAYEFISPEFFENKSFWINRRVSSIDMKSEVRFILDTMYDTFVTHRDDEYDPSF
nr:hypothetical protein [Nanoarchaeum sp.]